jgi:hypothetical protein
LSSPAGIIRSILIHTKELKFALNEIVHSAVSAFAQGVFLGTFQDKELIRRQFFAIP